ncbi:MAG: hypothetical protein L0323_13190 [Planctomycetes bacterium]|nr:hypothetical protein [Planctomycetota bacterium]
MTALDLAELSASYLEGSLRIVDGLRFRVRLATCRTLRRYVAALRALARIAGYTPRVLPPPDVARRILRRFRDWDGSGRPRDSESNAA